MVLVNKVVACTITTGIITAAFLLMPACYINTTANSSVDGVRVVKVVNSHTRYYAEHWHIVASSNIRIVDPIVSIDLCFHRDLLSLLLAFLPNSLSKQEAIYSKIQFRLYFNSAEVLVFIPVLAVVAVFMSHLFLVNHHLAPLQVLVYVLEQVFLHL